MVLGSVNVSEANVAYIFRTKRFSIVKMQAAGSSGTLALPYRAANLYTPQSRNIPVSLFTYLRLKSPRNRKL